MLSIPHQLQSTYRAKGQCNAGWQVDGWKDSPGSCVLFLYSSRQHRFCRVTCKWFPTKGRPCTLSGTRATLSQREEAEATRPYDVVNRVSELLTCLLALWAFVHGSPIHSGSVCNIHRERAIPSSVAPTLPRGVLCIKLAGPASWVYNLGRDLW